MKYLLLRPASVDIIRNALRSSSHDDNSTNCEDWPPGTSCEGCKGQEQREAALKHFDQLPWGRGEP